MKKVYIAGPYAADTEEQKDVNITAARLAAAQLYRKGWSPFVPHTMTANFELYYPDIKRQTYLETDLAWLECCDAVLMLDGWENSHGAVMEKCQANRMGIPVYYAVKDVPDLRKKVPWEAEWSPRDMDAINCTPVCYPEDNRARCPYDNKLLLRKQISASRVGYECPHCGRSWNNSRVQMNDDAINHPPHYTHGKMECITAIEGLGLPFHEAQVLKYITRWRHKHGLNDLRKAQWYLVRLMRLELKRLSDVGETRWDLPQGGERDACSTDTAAGD